MDSIQDEEIQDIWQRTSKKINLSNIKSVDPDGMASELSKEMRTVTKYSDQTNVLLGHGFPDRAVSVDNIRQKLQAGQFEQAEFISRKKTVFVTRYKKGIKIAGKSVGGRFITRTTTKATLIKRTEGKLKKL